MILFIFCLLSPIRGENIRTSSLQYQDKTFCKVQPLTVAVSTAKSTHCITFHFIALHMTQLSTKTINDLLYSYQRHRYVYQAKNYMLAGILLSTVVGVAMLDSGMFVYLDNICLKSSPRMVSSTTNLSTILSIASLLSLHAYDTVHRLTRCHAKHCLYMNQHASSMNTGPSKTLHMCSECAIVL